jgi:hypothetical protein
MTVGDIRKALHMLGSEIQNEAIDGITWWSLVSEPSPPPSARGVHLLHAYDELIVGYTESRFFGDPRAAAVRAASRDRRVPNGVVVVNGRLFGHWRRRIEKDWVRIEILAYEDLNGNVVRALESAAEGLGRFLRRHATVEVIAL